MSINDSKIIKLTTVEDLRGDLSFVESKKNIPFLIKRCYYIYNVPDNASRGEHAHKKLQQFLIAISGSFLVELDDGHFKKSFKLDSPDKGLFIPNMLWRNLSNFSNNAICLALVSDLYKEEDYIRDYETFKLIQNDNTIPKP